MSGGEETGRGERKGKSAGGEGEGSAPGRWEGYGNGGKLGGVLGDSEGTIEHPNKSSAGDVFAKRNHDEQRVG